jgi:hypothetical protein
MALRDTEGRACRKPKISRTNAIKHKRHQQEWLENGKRGQQGSPDRAGAFDCGILNSEEGQ